MGDRVGYPKDLDEYTDNDLAHELQRRLLAKQQNLCSYCGRSGSESPCKFPERHKQVKQVVVLKAQ